MQYFHSKKACVTTEIMIQVLTTLNRKLEVEIEKHCCFQITPHLTLNPSREIKITTSQLQPSDAGIIQNFKVKYRKQLLKHVISRVSDGKKASEIQGIDLLQCIIWVNQAFEQITKDTIKHCFKKCWFSEVSLLAEEPDEEFEDLLNSLTIDVLPDEYAS